MWPEERLKALDEHIQEHFTKIQMLKMIQMQGMGAGGPGGGGPGGIATPPNPLTAGGASPGPTPGAESVSAEQEATGI